MRILTYAVRKAMGLTNNTHPANTNATHHQQDGARRKRLSTYPSGISTEGEDGGRQGKRTKSHHHQATKDTIDSNDCDQESRLFEDQQLPSKRLKLSENAFLINTQFSNQICRPSPSSPHRKEEEKIKDLSDDDQSMNFVTKQNLPQELEKYWAQRNRLFWKFDQGIRMDKESWYSVTPEAIAKQIAARSSCKVIVDAFCGAGGNSIQFAMTCDKVIAIDNDPNKIKLARHNSKVYGVDDKIEFICTDFINWIQAQKPGSVDIIFLSPPWGGINYLDSASKKSRIETENEGNEASKNLADDYDREEEEGYYYKLSQLEPVDGKTLYDLTNRITNKIIFYLPRHLDLIDLSKLISHPHQSNLTKDQDHQKLIEVEENWMNLKCKALTVYFGDLISSNYKPDSSSSPSQA